MIPGMPNRLGQKLEAEAGQRVRLFNAPEGIAALLDEQVKGLIHLDDEADLANLAVYFATTRAELLERLVGVVEGMYAAGSLWIAWPKPGTGRETDLTFDEIQRIGIQFRLITDRICAIDLDWAALRFSVARYRRPGQQVFLPPPPF